MTLEESIAALIRAELAPVVAEMRATSAALESLRQSLPAQLVTVPEAAQRLGLSAATVRRRVKDGTLPARRVGKSIRVDLSALSVIRDLK
jgi:excisionase family DNA binding protein